MVVHAKPKTQPGGVHGAFAKPSYQSEGTSFAREKTSNSKCPKINKQEYDESVNHFSFHYSDVVFFLVFHFLTSSSRIFSYSSNRCSLIGLILGSVEKCKSKHGLIPLYSSTYSYLISSLLLIRCFILLW